LSHDFFCFTTGYYRRKPITNTNCSVLFLVRIFSVSCYKVKTAYTMEVQLNSGNYNFTRHYNSHYLDCARIRYYSELKGTVQRPIQSSYFHHQMSHSCSLSFVSSHRKARFQLGLGCGRTARQNSPDCGNTQLLGSLLLQFGIVLLRTAPFGNYTPGTAALHIWNSSFLTKIELSWHRRIFIHITTSYELIKLFCLFLCMLQVFSHRKSVLFLALIQ
jgi:hypothetical protein